MRLLGLVFLLVFNVVNAQNIRVFELSGAEKKLLKLIDAEYVTPTNQGVLMEGSQFISETSWYDRQSEAINHQIFNTSEFDVLRINTHPIPLNLKGFQLYDDWVNLEPFTQVGVVDFNFKSENKLIPAIFLIDENGRWKDIGIDFSSLLNNP